MEGRDRRINGGNLAADDPRILLRAAYVRLADELESGIRTAKIAAFGDCSLHLRESLESNVLPRYWVELQVGGEPDDGVGCDDLEAVERATEALLFQAKVLNVTLSLGE